jgi:hypothetical protein
MALLATPKGYITPHTMNIANLTARGILRIFAHDYVIITQWQAQTFK